MKTITNFDLIVVPDVHLKHHLVDEFLKSVTYKKIIFLGDYFDDFGDDPYQNEDTAKWLRKSIYKDNRVHLIGNHDLPYMFNGQGYYCSGYTNVKNKFINEILKEQDWRQLKLYHLEQINGVNWLFTHAGFTRQWTTKKNADSPLNILVNEEEVFNYSFDHGITEYTNMFSACSPLSGGSHAHSGILWCRLKEFTPIKGLNQMFGHTPTVNNDLKPLELYTGNWAIDTHLNYIITIDSTGKVSYHKV